MDTPLLSIAEGNRGYYPVSERPDGNGKGVVGLARAESFLGRRPNTFKMAASGNFWEIEISVIASVPPSSQKLLPAPDTDQKPLL